MPLARMENRDGSVTWEIVPECCRCGVCCLSEPCPVGVLAFGLAPGPGLGRPRGRCPGLSFDGEGRAVCSVCPDSAGRFSDVWAALNVAPADRARFMGFGSGCCIKAHVEGAGGRSIPFATLPDGAKLMLGKHHPAAAGLVSVAGEEGKTRGA